MGRKVGWHCDDEGEPPVPSGVDPQRACDFCERTPTTHWLTFTASTKKGWTLPGHLGACSTCAANIDFTNAKQLVKLGGQPKDIAKLLASHFASITPGI
jgi:hypothetical protein